MRVYGKEIRAPEKEAGKCWNITKFRVVGKAHNPKYVLITALPGFSVIPVRGVPIMGIPATQRYIQNYPLLSSLVTT